MRKKAFVLPVVLIVFSIISLISISSYYRVINVRTNSLSKEMSIERKLNKYSLEEIFKTKKFKNYINSLITNKKNLKINLDNDEIFEHVGINLDDDLKSEFENYKITLYVSQGKKDSAFTSESPYNLTENVKFYEVFIHVIDKKNSEIFEYRIRDNDRIENYIFDYQLKKLIIEDKKIEFKNFIIALEKNNLYDRVFSEENSKTLSGDYRFYDYDNKILYIESSKFTTLLNEYILGKYENISEDISFRNLSLSKVEEFFSINNFEECKKDEFLDILIANSKTYKNKYDNYKFVGIKVDKELVFDFESSNNFILNIQLNEESKIISYNKPPIISGVLVDKSNYDNIDYKIEGICFSDKEEIENYTFKPYELLRCTNFFKLSDNYRIEKVETTDIKN